MINRVSLCINNNDKGIIESNKCINFLKISSLYVKFLSIFKLLKSTNNVWSFIKSRANNCYIYTCIIHSINQMSSLKVIVRLGVPIPSAGVRPC